MPGHENTSLATSVAASSVSRTAQVPPLWTLGWLDGKLERTALPTPPFPAGSRTQLSCPRTRDFLFAREAAATQGAAASRPWEAAFLGNPASCCSYIWPRRATWPLVTPQMRLLFKKGVTRRKVPLLQWQTAWTCLKWNFSSSLMRRGWRPEGPTWEHTVNPEVPVPAG